jgi:prepilin-type N-terminal cleavage/methylation domain-containing protein
MDRLSAPTRRAAGFTLVEVLVALGILATGLLVVAAAQLHALRGGATGRHTSDAAAIAHSRIEGFQRMDFADPALQATAGWSAPITRTTDVQTPDAIGAVEMTYTVQHRITDLNANLKSIDVQVVWDEPARPGRSVTLSTLVHRDPESQS